MHLIIGGAYQGKLTFAKKEYGFKEEEICFCTQEKIDFSKACITHLEEYTYGCALRGEDPRQCFEEHWEEWKDAVLICRDISCGVVPLEKQDRMWREITGELCQYLAGKAEKVSKLFCGLEQRLK